MPGSASVGCINPGINDDPASLPMTITIHPLAGAASIVGVASAGTTIAGLLHFRSPGEPCGHGNSEVV
jgi:hypothetical protein